MAGPNFTTDNENLPQREKRPLRDAFLFSRDLDFTVALNKTQLMVIMRFLNTLDSRLRGNDNNLDP